MGELRIGYVFRRPRYPVLCALGDDLVAARTRDQLEGQLARRGLPKDKTFPIIDATGEGWGLHTELMVVSPLVMKKVWRKSELVKLYRKSAVGQEHADGHDDKVWLRLRLDQVVSAIVLLIEKAQTPNPSLQRPGRTGRAPGR